MKTLIIGGTKFVGRHLIDALVRNGHEVTIFHRGKHPFKANSSVEEILGDRNSDLGKLVQGTWDAVIDTCGYIPQHVEQSAKALKNSTSLYVFISSISAYADFSEPDFDEDAPLAALTPEQNSDFAKIDPAKDLNAYALGEMYGALKVMCEEVVARAFPESALIIRPGLIVGKYDWTDRFTYWVMRVASGGDVLAPGDPNGYVQIIDGSDLAHWTVEMIENGETGIYNAAGKPFSLTFGKMLNEIKRATESDSEFSWVNDRFMEQNEIAPWSDMPVYISDTEESKGFSAANIDKAVAKGLRFRDLKDTVLDTYRWRKALGGDLKSGISRKRENSLVDEWRKQNS